MKKQASAPATSRSISDDLRSRYIPLSDQRAFATTACLRKLLFYATRALGLPKDAQLPPGICPNLLRQVPFKGGGGAFKIKPRATKHTATSRLDRSRAHPRARGLRLRARRRDSQATKGPKTDRQASSNLPSSPILAPQPILAPTRSSPKNGLPPKTLFPQQRLGPRPKRGRAFMLWTTPTLIEVCVGLEINGYLPAEF